MTTYARILYTAATKNIVPKEALFTLAPSRSTIWHKISRAKSMEHIREIECELKRPGRSKLHVSYIIITGKGLQYLKDKYYRHIPWAEYLNIISPSTMRIVPCKVSRRQLVTTYFRAATAGIMADAIGANETTLFYEEGVNYFLGKAHAFETEEVDVDEAADMYASDGGGYDYFDEEDLIIQEPAYNNNIVRQDLSSPQNTASGNGSDEASLDTGKTGGSKDQTLSRIVTEAMEDYSIGLGQKRYGYEVIQSRSDLVFIDSLTMKREAEKLNQDSGRTYDVRAGRYAGLLHNHKKTVLVYVSTSSNVLGWDSKYVSREKFTFQLIRRMLFHEDDATQETNGILLVQNESVFLDTYNSRVQAIIHRRNNRSLVNVIECGEGLETLYAVPISYEGNRELKAIMEEDLDEERRTVIDDLISFSGLFPTDGATSPDLFPLMTTDRRYIAVELHIDVRRLKLLDAHAARMPDKRFAVYCRKWQVPYYKSIFSRIDICAIDEDLSDMNITDPASYEMKMSVERESEIVRAGRSSKW